MKYEKIKKYSEEKYRRISGVKRGTFEKMIEILKTAYDEKHKRRGRHTKLTIEDMLLAALEYWREYRTYAHIAASYGIDESNIYRLIKWIEDVLIKDGTFSLPGKKALLSGEVEIDLKDVTESPIERPKKNMNATDTTQAKNAGTQKKGS
jgi:transcription initiation factor TFIIIB Brf1 subunit/transcription initiation factor TFIIB